MKTLLILRHAKSSWDYFNLSDHDRPLNKRGKKDAPLMGELLLHEDLIPELIISSTAKRAIKTAEYVAYACGFTGKLQATQLFYHADPETYLEVLQALPRNLNRILIVGHNPGLEELVEDLTGESVVFTTANIAQIELLIDQWSELSFDQEYKLVNLWKPREL